MPNYRKKPVVIEARQWDGTAAAAGPLIDWMLAHDTTARYHGPHPDEPPEIVIHTLEGTMSASPRDWIIKGVEDEFYAVKPGIFEQTYEPADP